MGPGSTPARVRELGWTPIGIDLSAGMLRHASARLIVAQADAVRLPLADGSLDAAISVMVHTDLPEYRPVLDEILRRTDPDCVLAAGSQAAHRCPVRIGHGAPALTASQGIASTPRGDPSKPSAYGGQPGRPD